MPSKELTTAVILAITNAERKGINLEPLDRLEQMLLNDEDFIRPLAEAAISAILAALQEDKTLHEMIERHFNFPHGQGFGKDRLSVFLRHSPLGEQSE